MPASSENTAFFTSSSFWTGFQPITTGMAKIDSSTKNTLTISRPQVIEIPGNICFSEQVFYRNIPWVPLTLSKCFISTLHVFGSQRNLEDYLSYKTVLKSGKTKPAFHQLISPKQFLLLKRPCQGKIPSNDIHVGQKKWRQTDTKMG